MGSSSSFFRFLLVNLSPDVLQCKNVVSFNNRFFLSDASSMLDSFAEKMQNTTEWVRCQWRNFPAREALDLAMKLSIDLDDRASSIIRFVRAIGRIDAAKDILADPDTRERDSRTLLYLVFKNCGSNIASVLLRGIPNHAAMAAMLLNTAPIDHDFDPNSWAWFCHSVEMHAIAGDK